MTTALLSRRVAFGLFALLAIVYVLGLFPLLMDNDSAHHANIALHMYLTGDYTRLVSDDGEYLDKPHLLFWLSAISFQVFGVRSFAYRLPSLLFTVLGVWSTYRLGQTLYNRAVGQLAALMTASAFALMLAGVDVRMEAILTAAGVFAAWQGVEWLRKHRLLNALGLALGLALGFCTKGWSGLICPVTALGCYVVATRSGRRLLHPHVGLMVLAFALLIAPVLYCYYLQFDLHPEKVIRGRAGRSGVAFILWHQNFERFAGEAFGSSGSHNRFFYFHTFLWAFAPWSLLAYAALFHRFRHFRGRPADWMVTVPFVVMAIVIGGAGYRLPHYLNVMLPFTALLTAAFYGRLKEAPNLWVTVQQVSAVLLLLPVAVVTAWSFPPRNPWVLVGLGGFLLAACYLLSRSKRGKARALTLSVLSAALVFYLLNTNFYPQLLTYQAGNRLAFSTRGRVDPLNVYYWPGLNCASYNFYARELRKVYADSLLTQKDTLWLLANREALAAIRQAGLPLRELIPERNYPTDKLKARFLNPATRYRALDTLWLVRIQ